MGACSGGEPGLAIAMAGSAAGMLVIMDRGFPGVALWKAYTQAGAHLLIRARSCVARRPVQVLADGTYLARMNLAGQKGAHPGGVVVRVAEYRVDGGEVVRLLTDLVESGRNSPRQSWRRCITKDGRRRLHTGRSRRSSGVRRRCCARLPPNWYARRCGRIWLCTTA